jgi:hypothetical protein
LTEGDGVILQFDLDTPSDVRVRVYTTALRRVASWENKEVPPGTKLALFMKDPDGVPFANGLYHVVVETNKGRFPGKLLILK